MIASPTRSVVPVPCGGRRRRGAASELRRTGLAGSPAGVVDALGRFAEIGAGPMYLAILDLADLDHLALVAAEVLPAAARL